jgi:hypothetical protein
MAAAPFAAPLPKLFRSALKLQKERDFIRDSRRRRFHAAAGRRWGLPSRALQRDGAVTRQRSSPELRPPFRPNTERRIPRREPIPSHRTQKAAPKAFPCCLHGLIGPRKEMERQPSRAIVIAGLVDLVRRKPTTQRKPGSPHSKKLDPRSTERQCNSIPGSPESTPLSHFGRAQPQFRLQHSQVESCQKIPAVEKRPRRRRFLAAAGRRWGLPSRRARWGRNPSAEFARTEPSLRPRQIPCRQTRNAKHRAALGRKHRANHLSARKHFLNTLHRQKQPVRLRHQR